MGEDARSSPRPRPRVPPEALLEVYVTRARPPALGTAASGGDFLPVPVGDLELTRPAPPAPNAHGQRWLLVRLHGVPVGVVSQLQRRSAPGPDPTADAVAQFDAAVGEHLNADGLSSDDLSASLQLAADLPCVQRAAPAAGAVTVVICTLGEDPRLQRTVASVLAQSHGDVELVVVDNNPASGGVRRLLDGVSDPRLRVVPEARRGLSYARNTGLAAAGGDFVAYTDDDAHADRDWVRRLVAPFAEHPAVVCVTGLVLPAELSTPAQVLFEEFGAFDKGFERVVWSAGNHAGLHELGRAGDKGVLFPYSAGVFGSGNNMAFRTGWLRDQGGFDVALGAGTRSRGGEDLDAFLRVMLAGGVIVYDPRALVRHHARDDMVALEKQMYGYGSGMSAVIAKHFTSSPARALGIIARVPSGLRRLLDPTSSKNEAKSAAFPPALTRAERRGFLAGPLLYRRSLGHARRVDADATDL